MPRRLRDDARHERPRARSLSEMRWFTAPKDLRAEDQSLQLFEPDRGEIREGFRGEEIAKEQELQKVYERIWLPPPVQHSPWD